MLKEKFFAVFVVISPLCPECCLEDPCFLPCNLGYSLWILAAFEKNDLVIAVNYAFSRYVQF